MAKIFFSYRSADSAVAERIHERLNYNYGRDNVHLDVHPSIRDVQDLRSYVEDFLRPYAVLVVVIGPTWLRSRGGVRRLDDPQDVVRAEIATALASGIPVVPLLVRSADMPQEADLPDELKTLAQVRPQVFGSDESFRGDMMRLHNRLAATIVQHETSPTVTERVDAAPSHARKDVLKEISRGHAASGKPPFEGARIETLGEVLWILGAQYGELGKLYGERQFAPDLSGANLSYLNLSSAELYGAKLVGANLTGADLSGATLTQAILSDADLTGVNLSQARLDRAVLASARLQLANLTGCSLEGANVSLVDLTTTILTGTVMEGATLQGAILTGLELPDARLGRADLSGADLRDVAFERAHLQEAVMDRARLDGADLSGADLTGADLSGASLRSADLSGTNLTGATIESAETMRHVIIDAQTHFEHVKWGGKPIKDPRHIADRAQRLRTYREVAQLYHDIAELLRDAGFLSEASTYRLLEHRMRRGVLFTARRYGAWLFSAFLNVISGYGERISRTLVTYLIIILAFAAFYFVGANYLQLQPAHLSVGDAFIQSLVSFHGRGFVSSALQLGDRMAGVTVAEAVCGLFVEAIFIATFSRRFLGF